MPRSVLRVGTRGSALALAQAETIRKAVSNVITHRSFELVPVTTTGDTIEGELPPLGGKGLFVSDIQEALASGKIDLAVHSAKDLPAKGTDGVVLAAIPKREDPRDALVTRTGAGLNSLQPGTTVGTSSMRRRTQLLALQRGLVPTPIRGNVDTRLRKLSDGEVQALVVALAEADAERVRIRGLVGTLDGKRVVQDQVEGDDPEKTGLELADRLRAMGAEEIIASARA